MRDIDVSLTAESGWAVVAVSGTVNARTALQMRLAVEQALDQGASRLAIDLDGVSFMSSAGLGVITFAFQALAGKGFVALCGVSEIVRGPMDMSGLSQLVPIYGSLRDVFEDRAGTRKTL